MIDPNSQPPAYTPNTSNIVYPEGLSPPPTYASLFEQINTANMNSNGRGQFVKTFWEIVFSSIGFAIFVAVSLALPVAMIVVGALNLNNCPVERFIPIWLVISGSASIVIQLLHIAEQLQSKFASGQDIDEIKGKHKAATYVSYLVELFVFAWFIAGNVWVYRIYHPNTSDPSSSVYCEHSTYYFSFWAITVVYIFIGLMILSSCCVAGSRKENTNTCPDEPHLET